MQLLKFFLIICLPLIFVNVAQAQTVRPLEKRTVDTVLVFDEVEQKAFPRNFRSSFDLNECENVTFPFSLKGLHDLNASASAQFSVYSLKAALEKISSKNIWIIDLRRESHGFINGLPISWYSHENQGNKGMKIKHLFKVEAELLLSLKKEPFVNVHQILEKNAGTIERTQSCPLTVDRIQSEQDVATCFSLNYLRLPVSDHHRPDNTSVDQFIALVKQLPSDAWLYFHCRGGKGRSSTFMVMYDILRNGSTVSLEDILARQAFLGGSDLFVISEKPEDAWKKKAAIERQKFISQFYQYAISSDGYPGNSFSAYLKAQI